MRHRCNLTPASHFRWRNAEIRVPGPQRTQRITESEIVISLLLGWQIDNGFALKCKSAWSLLKSWYTGVGPEQGFRRRLAEGVNHRFRFFWDVGQHFSRLPNKKVDPRKSSLLTIGLSRI